MMQPRTLTQDVCQGVHYGAQIGSKITEALLKTTVILGITELAKRFLGMTPWIPVAEECSLPQFQESMICKNPEIGHHLKKFLAFAICSSTICGAVLGGGGGAIKHLYYNYGPVYHTYRRVQS